MFKSIEDICTYDNYYPNLDKKIITFLVKMSLKDKFSYNR